jgi:hypothetical protein
VTMKWSSCSLLVIMPAPQQPVKERQWESTAYPYAMKHEGKGLDDKLEKSETRYQHLCKDISNGSIYVLRLVGSIKGY